MGNAGDLFEEEPVDEEPVMVRGPQEVEAREMHNASSEAEADLMDRATFIGGSDAPIIIGVSPWKTRYELWMEKTGRIPPADLSEVERVMAGTLMEETIAKLYTWKFGVKLRRINERIPMPGAAFPAVAQIDRKVEGMRRIVEIKNTDISQRKLWGPEGSGEIPVYYYAQIQHQLMCSGYEDAEAAPLFGGNTLQRFPIARDQAFIDSLYLAEAEFWQCVKTDTPPEPINCEEATLAWSDPASVKVPAEILAAHLVGYIQQQKNEAKELEHNEAMAKLLLMRMMENKGDTLTVGGKPVCTWKMGTKKVFDQEEFKKAHPDLFAWYTKETTGRTFRLSKAGKETSPDYSLIETAFSPILALGVSNEDEESEE
jgi:putative phage-type endonuclease